ncbi:hypothetical protein EVAR_357_1 [Eumeta japonica]|uniref:Uncharacterized protein n=1 Tax=Eumeta variegata TaxID=151549 RepID=A0A4C1SC37_EUMVA|nr:hypothetical protein EVAR_357_1 [Eumeta japonica]
MEPPRGVEITPEVVLIATIDVVTSSGAGGLTCYPRHGANTFVKDFEETYIRPDSRQSRTPMDINNRKGTALELKASTGDF